MIRSENLGMKARQNFLKGVAFFAVLSCSVLYSPASFGGPSPLDASSVSPHDQPVISSAPMPTDLPELKQPAATVAANADPLAWDNPAPAPEAGTPKMPAVAVTAVEKVETIGKAETPKTVSGAPSDKVNALEKRLSTLEDTVAALKKRNTDLESLEVSVGELQQKVSGGQPVAEQSAPKKVKTAVVRHKVPKRPAPAVKWVLRSAKPGTAWVAEKESGALRSVSIGESLTGIGKVKSVTKDSMGHWVVSGTKGRISQ